MSYSDLDYQLFDKDDDSSLSFDYQFTGPKSSRGERRNTPYKTVQTENLVWSALSLTANLGGILSMTIGFSFLGALDYAISKIEKVSTGRPEFDYFSCLYATVSLVNVAYFLVYLLKFLN